MWAAKRWNDYQVLDTSGGEKLEQWGAYRLIRPDPQVIWNTKRSAEWDRINAHYHRSHKGGGEWEFFDLPEEWVISYPLQLQPSADGAEGSTGQGASGCRELHFGLKPFSFKHTGLFPEQAVNWDWFAPIIARAHAENPDREIRVLNLFAYTGAATISAAAAGARVTHVDASRGMVSWARENAAISGLSDAPIRWLVDDCTKFVEREIRRGNTYDAVILDPPSYGRGPKGEIWKMEDSIYGFLLLIRELLSEDPLFVLLNSYTTGLQPAVLSYLLHESLDPAHKAAVEADEIGLPVASSGLILPCGASGRWIAVR